MDFSMHREMFLTIDVYLFYLKLYSCTLYSNSFNNFGIQFFVINKQILFTHKIFNYFEYFKLFRCHFHIYNLTIMYTLCKNTNENSILLKAKIIILGILLFYVTK